MDAALTNAGLTPPAVFAAMQGIIDSTWHNAARILIKKMELGKQN